MTEEFSHSAIMQATMVTLSFLVLVFLVKGDFQYWLPSL